MGRKPQRRDVDWDEGKNDANKRKHAISFEEAATVFYDPLGITINDPDHSVSEQRFLTIGETDRRRLVVVAYTERAGKIRIISARKPTRRERKNDEES